MTECRQICNWQKYEMKEEIFVRHYNLYQEYQDTPEANVSGCDCVLTAVEQPNLRVQIV